MRGWEAHLDMASSLRWGDAVRHPYGVRKYLSSSKRFFRSQATCAAKQETAPRKKHKETLCQRSWCNCWACLVCLAKVLTILVSFGHTSQIADVVPSHVHGGILAETKDSWQSRIGFTWWQIWFQLYILYFHWDCSLKYKSRALEKFWEDRKSLAKH